MMELSEFERIVAERYSGARVVRQTTVPLPLNLKLHCAVLEDQHGRFAVATQRTNAGTVDVVRISDRYIEDAIKLYDHAITECVSFLRDLQPPVRPGGAIDHWVDDMAALDVRGRHPKR